MRFLGLGFAARLGDIADALEFLARKKNEKMQVESTVRWALGRTESASSPPMAQLSGNAKTIPELRGWGPRRTIDLWIRRKPNSRISEWSNAGRSNPNQRPSESRFDTKGIEKTKRITELITSPLTRVVSYQLSKNLRPPKAKERSP